MRLLLIVPTLVLLSIFFFMSVVSAEPTIFEYTKAIEDSPDEVKYKYFIMRGKAYKASGDINSALKDFSASILLKPTRDAYQSRGEIYLEKKRYNIAINDFTFAIEIRPSIELYKLRGRAYLNSGSYILAMSEGTEIIEREPNISESYNLMIEACEKQGEIETGREEAMKALSIDRYNKIANDFISKYPPQITLKGGDRNQLLDLRKNEIVDKSINSFEANARDSEKDILNKEKDSNNEDECSKYTDEYYAYIDKHIRDYSAEVNERGFGSKQQRVAFEKDLDKRREVAKGLKKRYNNCLRKMRKSNKTKRGLDKEK